MASQAILSLQLSRSPPSHRTNTNPSSLLLPPRRLLAPLFVIPRRRLKLLPLIASSAASSQASPVDRSHLDALERCLSISHDSCMPSCSAELSLSAPSSMSKKGRGGALSSTLERSKIEFTQAKKKKKPPEVSTGGGGGDIGKKIGHGGGDGGDDDGDDDDYFDDFDDGDEGDEGGLFRRRIVLQEVQKQNHANLFSIILGMANQFSTNRYYCFNDAPVKFKWYISRLISVPNNM